jgi:tRNA G18 (ribose-2'-O)-methylase SpoU
MRGRHAYAHPGRGYFAIGVYHPKTEVNVGSLYRTAHLYGAAFVFTVGHRYRPQASDTMRTPQHKPLFHYSDINDLIEHLPNSAPLVGVELDERAVSLPDFTHPERAVYLLGAEDHGLPPQVMDACHYLVTIPTLLPYSMNVAVAGSIVLYDRFTMTKELTREGMS